MARHGFRLAWAAAVLLALPGVRTGPLLDDFLHRALLEGQSPGAAARPWQLYDFSGVAQVSEWVARGHAPWHTHPELEIRFFRPLSSLSLALDHWLFGRAMLPAHLVNFALYLLLVGAAFAFFNQLLPRRERAWAALLYAVAGGHFMNTVWLASRHLLLSGIFVVWCVLLHVKRRETPRTQTSRVPVWAPPSLLVLGLFSSESALMGVAFITSYELFGHTGQLRARVEALLPCLLLGTSYLVFYGAAGYGARHSGVYLSPLSEPLRFLQAGVLRAAVVASELAAATPTFITNAAPQTIPALLIIAALLTSLIVLLLRKIHGEQSRRRVLWLSLAALLSTGVCIGGVIEGRLLVIPLIASTAVVGTAIAAGLSGQAPFVGKSPKLMAVALIVPHVAVAALIRVFAGEHMVKLSRAEAALAETFDATRCREGATGLIVTASDPSIALSWVWSLAYFRPKLLETLPSFYLLSMAPHPHALERTGPTTLTLSVADLPRRSHLFEILFRSSPLAPGSQVTWGALQATVLESDRGLPIKTRFEIPGNSCLIALQNQRLLSLPLPDPGAGLQLPYEPGPFGM